MNIEQLDKQLDLARQELINKENIIASLQETHAEEIRMLELERDQIIQSLMESEERYRIHISATTAVAYHGNALGYFSVPQTSWIDYTGQDWPEHRDQGWIRMIHEDQQASFAQKWKKQIELGETFTIECQIWAAHHQEYRHCEMNVIPILNTLYDNGDINDDTSSNSGVYAWIGSIVDIHERKLAEERILSTNELLKKTIAELQRSNMELERFVYIASHDLKEPLRGIQNLATMLIDLYQEQIDEEGRELLELINESGHRMQQLINALHKYSRVTLSYDSFQHVNTDRVLDEIIRGTERLPGQRAFIVQRLHPLPNLVCNPAHLQTIFQNLVSNALKYSNADLAIIEIDVVDPKGTDSTVPVFYVRDNGIGIKPEHYELVFDMFKRLHPESEYSGGTGAGLALVKKILDQYGGQIWLESELGAGSTFYFTLGNESTGNESTGNESTGNESMGNESMGNESLNNVSPGGENISNEYNHFVTKETNE